MSASSTALCLSAKAGIEILGFRVEPGLAPACPPAPHAAPPCHRSMRARRCRCGGQMRTRQGAHARVVVVPRVCAGARHKQLGPAAGAPAASGQVCLCTAQRFRGRGRLRNKQCWTLLTSGWAAGPGAGPLHPHPNSILSYPNFTDLFHPPDRHAFMLQSNSPLSPTHLNSAAVFSIMS